MRRRSTNRLWFGALGLSPYFMSCLSGWRQRLFSKHGCRGASGTARLFVALFLLQVLFVKGVVRGFRTAAFGHTFRLQPVAQRDRDIFVHRAGMGLLLLDSQLRQEIENDTGLNFKLARQLVYPNFLHRRDCLFQLLKAAGGYCNAALFALLSM